MAGPANAFGDLLPRLAAAVDEAGALIREHDRRPRHIRHKSSVKDLVTETDLAVEAMLRKSLGGLLPEAGFLGEEGSAGEGLDGLKWVVDPVDGTTNFAHGLPFVATSVALCRDGEPLLGVVNLPLLGELYAASRGGGATRNGGTIRVSATNNLIEALVATGFPYRIDRYMDAVLGQLSRALPATQGVRRPGAAALDLAYVACGRYEGFFEFALNPWDTAAGVLLVEEAGGRVGRMAGGPYRIGDADVLASNGRLHGALEDMLRAASATVP
jgi:myo-inositol-1(or 4)-monophosphatase